MSDVELKLSLEEAVAIVNLIGSLPTSQGAFPLFVKLKAQYDDGSYCVPTVLYCG